MYSCRGFGRMYSIVSLVNHVPKRLMALLTVACMLSSIGLTQPVFAYGRETPVPDIQFQPIRPTEAISIRESVEIALRNFPTITHRLFKLHAAQANVTLAKTQYLPNLNLDLQESAVSPNRIASVVMNNVSGFDTVPIDSGPSSLHSTMKPLANSLQGLNLNWLLVDFGLRHANDDFAYADARAARADLNLTKLDVAFDCRRCVFDSNCSKADNTFDACCFRTHGGSRYTCQNACI